MKIATTQLFERAIVRMGDLQGRAARLSADVSEQKHLTNASDDSVAFQRVTLVKRAVADEAQYADNVALAATLLTQADDALEGIETQVVRARELALRAANGTLTPADRRTIGIELQGVVDTMLSLANSTDARGAPLFGGATGGGYAKDAAGAITFSGRGTPPPIPISATATIAAGDSGARLFGGIAAGGTTTDMFAIVQNLADALVKGDAATINADINKGLDGLAAIGERLGNARASVGARGARLEIEAEQYATLATTREAERSEIEDTDVPATIAKLQQTMLALEATQASFAKLSQMSLFDYLR